MQQCYFKQNEDCKENTIHIYLHLSLNFTLELETFKRKRHCFCHIFFSLNKNNFTKAHTKCKRIRRTKFNNNLRNQHKIFI